MVARYMPLRSSTPPPLYHPYIIDIPQPQCDSSLTAAAPQSQRNNLDQEIQHSGQEQPESQEQLDDQEQLASQKQLDAAICQRPEEECTCCTAPNKHDTICQSVLFAVVLIAASQVIWRDTSTCSDRVSAFWMSVIIGYISTLVNSSVKTGLRECRGRLKNIGRYADIVAVITTTLLVALAMQQCRLQT